jgi:hypothetical protein
MEKDGFSENEVEYVVIKNEDANEDTSVVQGDSIESVQEDAVGSDDIVHEDSVGSDGSIGSDESVQDDDGDEESVGEDGAVRLEDIVRDDDEEPVSVEIVVNEDSEDSEHEDFEKESVYDEDDKEDDESVDFEVLCSEYNFRDPILIASMINAGHQRLFEYIADELASVCGEDNPCYALFRLYENEFRKNDSALYLPIYNQSLSMVFSVVYDKHPDISEDEFDRVMGTHSRPLFIIFIKSCDSDENPSWLFIEDVIASEEFYPDRIDDVVNAAEKIRTDTVFEEFISRGPDEYGNSRTYDHLFSLMIPDPMKLTEGELAAIEDRGYDGLLENIENMRVDEDSSSESEDDGDNEDGYESEETGEDDNEDEEDDF